MVNFASGLQSQTELRLYFGVCILQKFQQSSHRDGRFACGGYSLQAGAFGLGIEAFLELPAQFYTGGLLDMGVGVHQHICRSVTRCALHSLHIAAGDHQLIGGTGMPQTMKDDARELWVGMNEKKNRDCATSFLEIYVQPYDFEKIVDR